MATNIINGKKYIGQTKRDFLIRQTEHLKARDNYLFHVALRKYGSENFIWTILEECSNELLNEKETFWIEYYNSYNKGYNQTKGGDNANALVNWQKQNRKQQLQNAYHGLEYANQYWKNNPDKKLEQLKIAHAAARKSCK